MRSLVQQLDKSTMDSTAGLAKARRIMQLARIRHANSVSTRAVGCGRARAASTSVAGNCKDAAPVHIGQPVRFAATAAVAKLDVAHEHIPASHDAWTIIRTEKVSEHAATATLYEHKGTGAQLLSVVSSETEKVFGVAFRTVPADDTGVAHILEHSVLCGSAKFPSKEPFTELMKSSLQTYLNAMTYPDRTVYPVASPNVRDFHNLVRVYLDAVFAPNLHPQTLRQEGHHVTPKGLDGPGPEDAVPAEALGPLVYKGVVFNEMKGVYSSGDSIHGQTCEAALFPDTPYAHSSGGDPRAIPQLSYEGFTQFHADNYAPGRARLFFFGDDPEEARLALASDALSTAVPGGVARAAGSKPVPAAQQRTLTVQHPFPAPVTVNEPYPAAGAPAGEDAPAAESDTGFIIDYSLGPTGGLVPAPAPTSVAEGESGGLPPSATRAVPGVPDEHFVTVNWCLTGGLPSSPSQPFDESWAAHAISPEDRLGLSLLSHLLMGTQASTLRKALTDAGLGSGVTGGGLDDGVLQPVFAAGLKGVSAANVPKVEPLVLHSLTMAAGCGFDKDHVAASLNTLEFQLREFASGGGPRGLALFLGAAAGWTYGRDPIGELRYAEALEAVKGDINRQGSEYFQGLLRKYVLTNPHRATVHSYPDPSWTSRRESAEAAELAQQEAQLKSVPGGLEEVAHKAMELLEMQATPDPPEVLATIPTLSISDLGREQSSIPYKLTNTGSSVVGAGMGKGAGAGIGAPMLLHEQPTAGIGYLSLHWDLSVLPARLLPLLPLFSWCLTSMGTKGMDEVTLSRAIGAHTGGIGASVGVMEVPGARYRGIARLSLGGKALSDKGEALGNLLADVVSSARLDDKARITHALKDTVARHKAGLVGSGHRYAGGLLSAGLSLPGWLSEQWGGLTSLHVARSLLQGVAGASGEGVEPSMVARVSAQAWQQAYGEAGIASSSDGFFIPPTSFAALVSDLELIRSTLLTQSAMHSTVVTGDEASLKAVQTALGAVLSALPQGQVAAGLKSETPSSRGSVPWRVDSSSLLYPVLRAYAPDAGTARQAVEAVAAAKDTHSNRPAVGVGLVAPAAQVNFVAKAGNVAHVYQAAPSGGATTGGASGGGATKAGSASPITGGAEVASAVLRNGYLWDTVRVSGGAYGGFASLNRHTGNLSFASYRDPHLARTLGAFDASGQHMQGLAKDSTGQAAEELRKAIISTIGGIDAPMAPAERGDVSSARWAMGISQEQLQARREQVLGASKEDLQAFGQAAAAVAKHGAVAAVGSERAFAAAEADATPSTSTTTTKWILLRPMQ